MIATNQNDILHRCPDARATIDTDGVTPSISPSMDIQVSSNFERALFDAYGRDGAAVAQLMDELKAKGGFPCQPGRACRRCASRFASGRCQRGGNRRHHHRDLARRTGELLCPHSAVGVKVAQDHLGATPMITLATAHPAKFPDAVEAATGITPRPAAAYGRHHDGPERVTRVANDLAALQALIRERRAS